MDLHVLRLWDIYNPLLTEHQREVTDLYFNCDLSLTEIAAEKGCSKQSVSDTLSKCRAALEGYEEKLHVARMLAESSLAQSLMAAQIGEWARAHLSEADAAQLQTLIDRDYSEEAKALFQENRKKLV